MEKEKSLNNFKGRITYSYGKISNFSEDYFLLELFSKEDKCVYKCNIPNNELDVILAMNKNIIQNVEA